MVTPCPGDRTLSAFVSGDLDPRVHDHMADCAACRQTIAALARELPARSEGVLARYRIERVVGEGGMGVVVAARDHELDRPVAIKLARTGTSDEDTRARFIHEARALAQLNHPNVITIYDAGVVDGELFIVMELVEGGTLRDWLSAQPRSWREIVDVFVAAGRGLAAAHNAGIVHRDFKPTNVLMGNDARPRVSDFGLARSGPDLGERAEPAAAAVGSATTQTGNVLGTPYYMAPEQRAGRTSHPRSDQFSFCVALYEALHGRHPFVANAPEPSADTPAEDRDRVPRGLRQIIARGLADTPEARWPSMDALLDALDRRLHNRRWRSVVLGVAFGAIAVIAVAAVAWQRDHGGNDALICRGAERKLDGIWDAPRKQRIEAAFTANAGLSSWNSVRSTLDKYAADWVAMYTDACEATHVRGEQSEHALDLRMDCLDQRRTELAALTEVLARADAQVVPHAADAARELSSLRTCADVAALTATLPPPNDPTAVSQIDQVRAQLAHARALEQTGKINEALAAARSTLQPALKLDYAPLLAEVHQLIGLLSDAAGDHKAAETSLDAALVAAESSRHERVRLGVLASLGRIVGIRFARLDEGVRLVGQAEAAMAHRSLDDGLHVYVLDTMGALLLAQGKTEAAADYFKRSSELAEKTFPSDDRRLANALYSFADVCSQLGRLDESWTVANRVLAIQERSLGPDHPDLARPINLLGGIALARGQVSEAEALFLRDLHLWEKAFGPDDGDLSVPLGNLGVIAEIQKNYDQAIAYQSRALAVLETARGPDHPDLIGPLINLGSIALTRKQYPEATARFGRAIELGEHHLGHDHPSLIPAITGMGLGYVHLGQSTRAIPYLERALALSASTPPSPARATAQFALARVLWPRDPQRALSLAHAARDGFASDGPLSQEDLTEVDGWLAHRAPR